MIETEKQDDSVAEILLANYLLAMKEADRVMYESKSKAWGLKLEAQRYCTHPDISQTNGGDYHRGIYWKELHCRVCSKHINEDDCN